MSEKYSPELRAFVKQQKALGIETSLIAEDVNRMFPGVSMSAQSVARLETQWNVITRPRSGNKSHKRGAGRPPKPPVIPVNVVPVLVPVDHEPLPKPRAPFTPKPKPTTCSYVWLAGGRLQQCGCDGYPYCANHINKTAPVGGSKFLESKRIL